MPDESQVSTERIVAYFREEVLSRLEDGARIIFVGGGRRAGRDRLMRWWLSQDVVAFGFYADTPTEAPVRNLLAVPPLREPGGWDSYYQQGDIDPDGPDAGQGATIEELIDDIDRVLDEHRSEP